MKATGLKPKKVNSGMSNVPVIIAFESSTGKLVPRGELNSICLEFLAECRSLQIGLVLANVDGLPQRADSEFGSKWARENVQKPDSVSVPEDYIEKYWTLNGDKIEAARLILAHRERDKVAKGFDEIGWDATCEELKDHISPDKWLDWRLVKNIKASGKHPESPDIKHPRFPFNQMNNQVCQQIAFGDIVCCHNMAIGRRRLDIVFYMGALEKRYPNIEKVGRPTLRLVDDDHVAFDFSVIERIPVRDVQRGHVVTFDRNMDHEHIISGARMTADGTVSRELGPSVGTLKAINKLKVLQVERERCRKKIANLMPHHDPEKKARLVQQEKHLDELVRNLKDAIDWMEVDDIRRHVLADELLGVEQLDMFGGGYVKFRHGSTDDKLEHATARDGGQLTHVNPSGSSTKCPSCGTRMTKDAEAGSERCASCGYETSHDYGANVVLGTRTFKKMGVDVAVAKENLPSLELQEERSVRLRAKRQAKMKRRKARGKRTYRVKEKATPRRPRTRGSQGEVVQQIDNSSKKSLEELREIFESGYETRLEGMKGDGSKGDAGAISSVSPLLPWGATNVFVRGTGWSTCHAFFEDLYVRSMLTGAISPPDTPDEAGMQEPAASHLQMIVSIS